MLLWKGGEWTMPKRPARSPGFTRLMVTIVSGVRMNGTTEVVFSRRLWRSGLMLCRFSR